MCFLHSLPRVCCATRSIRVSGPTVLPSASEMYQPSRVALMRNLGEPRPPTPTLAGAAAVGDAQPGR